MLIRTGLCLACEEFRNPRLTNSDVETVVCHGGERADSRFQTRHVLGSTERTQLHPHWAKSPPTPPTL